MRYNQGGVSSVKGHMVFLSKPKGLTYCEVVKPRAVLTTAEPTLEPKNMRTINHDERPIISPLL